MCRGLENETTIHYDPILHIPTSCCVLHSNNLHYRITMKLKLLEKIEGYEDIIEFRKIEIGDMHTIDGVVAISGGTQSYGHVLTPERKFVNWALVDDKVIVSHGKGLLRVEDVMSESFVGYAIDNEWQAHIMGDKCPVDPDAFRVDVRGPKGEVIGVIWRDLVSINHWRDITQFKVTGLAPGYEYPSS